MFKATCTIQDRSSIPINVDIDFTQGVDIALSVGARGHAEDSSEKASQHTCSGRPSVSAFYLPTAKTRAIQVGSWVGDIQQGANVNCANLEFSPHGAGTHTECVGHIMMNGPTINDLAPTPSLVPAILLTPELEVLEKSEETYVPSHSSGQDTIVTRKSLVQALAGVKAALSENGKHANDFIDSIVLEFTRAVVIRTWTPNRMTSSAASESETGSAPRGPHGPHVNFSGQNPPYLTIEAATYLAEELRAKHVVVDLPSVDREDDGGFLVAHRTIFGYNLPLDLASGKNNRVLAKERLTAQSAFVASSRTKDGDDGSKPSTEYKRSSSSTKNKLESCTITELAWFESATTSTFSSPPDASSAKLDSKQSGSRKVLVDGFMMLDLQIAPIASDAAPSRPVLYPILSLSPARDSLVSQASR